MNDQVPISEARANLTELIATVRLQGRTVILTQRGKPRAAIVPLELLDRLEEAHHGGIRQAGRRETSSAG